ncbi:MAG TPA: protein translocase subunit SecF [Blastocatellia bacterium]|nr:protein translocase subunit SecF [Blastocatellia bacterium]
MVELFRNPQIDWLNAKKFFIGITILLLLLGAISVQLRGFNLGVDFTGGTSMTVRFLEMPALSDIRSALSEGGIDTTKVTLQPVTSRPNELMIHAPQLASGTEAQRRVDEDKRAIMAALQRLNPAGDVSAGRININEIDAAGMEAELRQVDPLDLKAQQFPTEHPYRQIGDQIIGFRNGPNKGFIQDISAIQGLNLDVKDLPNFDQSKVKSVLLERLYAGKIDLNLAGRGEIEDALGRIDPLGVGTGSDTYAKAAQAIADYRKNSNGVITDISLIQTQDVSAELLSKMKPYFTEGSYAVISADVVGAVVGQDLRNRAIYVTLAALAGMLVYIAFRFEWIYGVAAVLAVFHDIMITLGFFSLFQWEISLTVIAALLTLVGYSMNDTIVVFDRIRENLRLRRRDSLAQIANDSINQTLSRTVIAAGLTFISVVAIVLFGGEVLRGFALALTIGIIIGTYSSIAIASPMMLWWEYITGGKRGRGRPAEQKGRPVERTLARV